MPPSPHNILQTPNPFFCQLFVWCPEKLLAWLSLKIFAFICFVPQWGSRPLFVLRLIGLHSSFCLASGSNKGLTERLDKRLGPGQNMSVFLIKWLLISYTWVMTISLAWHALHIAKSKNARVLFTLNLTGQHDTAAEARESSDKVISFNVCSFLVGKRRPRILHGPCSLSFSLSLSLSLSLPLSLPLFPFSIPHCELWTWTLFYLFTCLCKRSLSSFLVCLFYFCLFISFTYKLYLSLGYNFFFKL